MRTSNTIGMRGDPDRIFQLAADIHDWPRILPHYRYVVVEERDERTKIARMGASRDGFPVKWRCRQELLPAERRILFHHIGGITKGMAVEWRIEAGGTANAQGESDVWRVTIDHELDYSNTRGSPDLISDLIAHAGAWFASAIIGKLFVHNIAGKTLRCIKAIVEAEANGASSSPASVR